uniref:Uncharacterized protein n=1 Tax=Eutreptiella gymnastica TaxID=73025 RepID=A0A7S1N319_9EUGL
MGFGNTPAFVPAPYHPHSTRWDHLNGTRQARQSMGLFWSHEDERVTKGSWESREVHRGLIPLAPTPDPDTNTHEQQSQDLRPVGAKGNTVSGPSQDLQHGISVGLIDHLAGWWVSAQLWVPAGSEVTRQTLTAPLPPFCQLAFLPTGFRHLGQDREPGRPPKKVREEATLTPWHIELHTYSPIRD